MITAIPSRLQKWCMDGGCGVMVVSTARIAKPRKTTSQNTATNAVLICEVMGMVNYYVIRNKETGFYFRGKGANRWGQYHNQASVYRMKAHAENTLRWLLRYGEPVEIVPIQIVENPSDIVEVVRCKDCTSGKGATHKVCPLYRDGLMKDDDFCSEGERK